jgi:hypothetical protein
MALAATMETLALKQTHAKVANVLAPTQKHAQRLTNATMLALAMC